MQVLVPLIPMEGSTTPQQSPPSSGMGAERGSYTSIIEKGRALQAKWIREEHEKKRAQDAEQAQLRRRRISQNLDGSRRRQSERDLEGLALGERWLTAIREEVAAKIEAEIKDDIGRQVQASEHIWISEFKQRKKQEIIDYLTAYHEPLVKAQVFEDNFETMKADLQRDLQPAVLRDLRNENEAQVQAELREELKNNVYEQLLRELRPAVEQQLREEILPGFEDQLKQEVSQQLHHDLGPKVTASLRESLYQPTRDEVVPVVTAQVKEELTPLIRSDLTIQLKHELQEAMRASLREELMEEMNQGHSPRVQNEGQREESKEPAKDDVSSHSPLPDDVQMSNEVTGSALDPEEKRNSISDSGHLPEAQNPGDPLYTAEQSLETDSFPPKDVEFDPAPAPNPPSSTDHDTRMHDQEASAPEIDSPEKVDDQAPDELPLQQDTSDERREGSPILGESLPSSRPLEDIAEAESVCSTSRSSSKGLSDASVQSATIPETLEAAKSVRRSSNDYTFNADDSAIVFSDSPAVKRTFPESDSREENMASPPGKRARLDDPAEAQEQNTDDEIANKDNVEKQTALEASTDPSLQNLADIASLSQQIRSDPDFHTSQPQSIISNGSTKRPSTSRSAFSVLKQLWSRSLPESNSGTASPTRSGLNNRTSNAEQLDSDNHDPSRRRLSTHGKDDTSIQSERESSESMDELGLKNAEQSESAEDTESSAADEEMTTENLRVGSADVPSGELRQSTFSEASSRHGSSQPEQDDEIAGQITTHSPYFLANSIQKQGTAGDLTPLRDTLDVEYEREMKQTEPAIKAAIIERHYEDNDDFVQISEELPYEDEESDEEEEEEDEGQMEDVEEEEEDEGNEVREDKEEEEEMVDDDDDEDEEVAEQAGSVVGGPESDFGFVDRSLSEDIAAEDAHRHARETQSHTHKNRTDLENMEEDEEEDEEDEEGDEDQEEESEDEDSESSDESESRSNNAEEDDHRQDAKLEMEGNSASAEEEEEEQGGEVGGSRDEVDDNGEEDEDDEDEDEGEESAEDGEDDGEDDGEEEEEEDQDYRRPIFRMPASQASAGSYSQNPASVITFTNTQDTPISLDDSD